ncbi:SDR family NAD(P)-dependent oxidoreductase [Nonomuraea sp. ZG12]|uniref:SDR family NAD(P)-dependent oxidoreductase n=1 Tax=Nonomuraea sp. ZG12 TaxID=3452207 RepID=UPI003F8ABB27
MVSPDRPLRQDLPRIPGRGLNDHALPHLIERSGTVINVSSVGARTVAAGPADYNVSKAALNALTKVIAEQFGEQGVPHESFVEQAISGLGVTTGRISTPEEVARLIAFLAAPSNITGNEYVIDGGMVKNV